MPQTKLDRYFVIPSTIRPGPGLLDLPYDVRQRIYLFVGVVRKCPIQLNPVFRLKREEHERNPIISKWSPECCDVDHEQPDCDCWSLDPAQHRPFPIQLLYTSRDVSDEVSFFIYSKDRFFISQSRRGGFSALFSFAPLRLQR